MYFVMRSKHNLPFIRTLEKVEQGLFLSIYFPPAGPQFCARNWKDSRIPLNRMAYTLGALILSFIILSPQISHARESFTLDAVRAQVKQDFGSVAQLSTQALAAQVTQGADILLLDVREADEYAVSRIEGAKRVDPGIWRWSFMDRFGDKVRGKTVVFYCAVGLRSSRLAEGVQVALKAQGATAVYNLDGGVFAWHNETRALVNANGATDFVHPFDKYWGRLVRRSTLLRTTPK